MDALKHMVSDCMKEQLPQFNVGDTVRGNEP